ncbi:hypothetical protein A3Q56_00294 [Intoshia linei]|uniref:Uncharacterized protein n=1 Tax=Intoshia linei TaxID=1819745 RepID=A0A177BCN0_9BILA|nr:hypothetical protein A3Q56_00294 [Intoshia linei]
MEHISLNYKNCELSEIYNIKDNIINCYQEYNENISTLLKFHTDLEKKRLIDIKKYFQWFYVKAIKIAYLTESEIRSLIESRTQKINIHLISNKRYYYDINYALTSTSIYEEKKLMDEWENIKKKWKICKIDTIIENFELNVKLQISQIYAIIIQVFDKTYNQNYKTEEKLNNINAELREFAPPKINKLYVNNMQKKYTLLINEYETNFIECIKHMENIFEIDYNRIIEYTDGVILEITNCNNDEKSSIVSYSGSESETSYVESIKTKCMKTLALHRQLCENELIIIDTFYDNLSKYQKKNMRQVFDKCKLIVRFWDFHVEKTKKILSDADTKLFTLRDNFQNQDNAVEHSLTILIEKLKQESNDKSLSTALKKISDQLENIDKIYESHYNKQCLTVSEIHNSFKFELGRYEKRLINHFSLVKSEKKVVEPVKQENVNINVFNLEKASSDSENSEKNENMEYLQQSDDYYIWDYIYNRELNRNSEDIINLYEKLFMKHYESYKIFKIKEIDQYIEEKTIDFKSSLATHKLLNSARYDKIYTNVYNVRVEECNLHQQRLNKHIAGVETELSQFYKTFLEKTNREMEQNQVLEKQLKIYEKQANEAKTQNVLTSISSSFYNFTKKHKEKCKTSFEKLKLYSTKTFEKLKKSCKMYSSNCVHFNDGGNFNQEETDIVKQGIENIEMNIINSDIEVQTEIQNLELRQISEISRITNEYDESLRNVIADVTFADKISRWKSNGKIKLMSEMLRISTLLKNAQQDIIVFDKLLGEKNSDQIFEYIPLIKKKLHYILLNIENPMKYNDIIIIKQETSNIMTFNTTNIANLVLNKSNEDESYKSLKKLVGLTKDITIQRKSNVIKLARKCSKISLKPLEKLKKADLKKNSANRNKKINKIDNKHFIFGIQASEDEKNYCKVIKNVRNELRTVLDGLLAEIDIYYRQKGTRPSTREGIVYEYFDDCIADILSIMTKYYDEAVQKHQDIFITFCDNVQQFQSSLKMIPIGVVQEEFLTQSRSMKSFIDEKLADHHKEINKFNKQMEALEKSLYPAFGHPSKRYKLTEMNEIEQKLYSEFIQYNKVELDKHLEISMSHKSILSEIKMFTVKIIEESENTISIESIIKSDNLKNMPDLNADSFDNKDLAILENNVNFLKLDMEKIVSKIDISSLNEQDKCTVKIIIKCLKVQI